MLKNLKQVWIPRICSGIPLDFWHRLLNVELVIPFYHVVSDQELPHVSWLYKFRNVLQFKADMEFFLRFYTPVSLQDVISHLDGDGKLPKRCFLPTFDDGFCEIYDVIAPILYAQGIPAVFFLTTSFIDNRELCYSQKKSLLIRALDFQRSSYVKQKVTTILIKAGAKGVDLASQIRTISYHQKQILDELGAILDCDFAQYVASAQPYLISEQIKDLIRQGFAIGAHSIDHPLYSELSLEEQLIQTHGSLSWLSNRFQYECQAFAFPFDDKGVCPEFFQKAFADGHLRVSFGIHSLHRHFFQRNLERFQMEKNYNSAKQILAHEFCTYLWRKPPWTKVK
jgi:peptidoglycan/xylan/chitin deacetylase (PgdA/CDA1 family)